MFCTLHPLNDTKVTQTDDTIQRFNLLPNQLTTTTEFYRYFPHQNSELPLPFLHTNLCLSILDSCFPEYLQVSTWLKILSVQLDQSCIISFLHLKVIPFHSNFPYKLICYPMITNSPAVPNLPSITSSPTNLFHRAHTSREQSYHCTMSSEWFPLFGHWCCFGLDWKQHHWTDLHGLYLYL